MDFSRLFSHQEVRKALKFGATGVANTLVDFGVFSLFRFGVGCSLVLAQVAGYFSGVVCSYTVNRKWTFSSEECFFSATMVRFLIVSGGCMALSAGLIQLVAGLGFHEMAAKLFTIAVTMTVNFLASRLWVFRPRDKGESDGEGKLQDNSPEQEGAP